MFHVQSRGQFAHCPLIWGWRWDRSYSVVVMSDIGWAWDCWKHHIFHNVLGIALYMVKWFYLANYSLAICGLWHTTLLWFVNAELGKSVLQCSLESAPEKTLLEKQWEIPTSIVRQWKICWIQDEITSSRSILYTAFGGWVSQTQGWFNVGWVKDLERENVTVGSGNI